MALTLANANPFPPAGTDFPIGVAFFDTTTGAKITGWTGATCTAYVNGALYGPALTVTELPAGSGTGYIDVPAAATANAQIVCLDATITNTNASEQVIFVTLSQAATAGPGGAGPSGLPTDFITQIQWLWDYFFSQNWNDNGGGTQTIWVPSSNPAIAPTVILCTRLTTANDLLIQAGQAQAP